MRHHTKQLLYRNSINKQSNTLIEERGAETMSSAAGMACLQRSFEVKVDASLDLEAAARRLETSYHVRELCLKVHEPSSQASFAPLCRALKSLRKLKTLTIESSTTYAVSTIPLSSLTLAVNQIGNIRDIFVGNMTLEGSIEDMASLSDALRQRPCLEEFSLVGCQFPRPTRTTGLDPLARVLAGLPRISAIQMHAREISGLGTLTSSAMSAICESKSLKELRLHNFDLTDDQVMSAARHMETNQVLEELSLSTCNFSIVTTAAFAKMLRRNSTLTLLELVPKAAVRDNFAVLIAEALEENTTIQHFALDGKFPVSQTCKDAFEQMLKENCHLQSFRLMSIGDSLPEFQMHIKLNKVGRAHLLNAKGTATRKDWLKTLAQVSNDLDCIFYCLSVNPYLCHTTKETQSQVRIQRRGNKRRRLNYDQDTSTPQNSSSVNSSLSSSENSSSPTQSEHERSNEEPNTSTDSDNVAQNGAQQITSTSESSNRNEQSGSDRNTGTSGSGAESNEDNGTNNNNQAVLQQQLLEVLFANLGDQSQQGSSMPSTSQVLTAGLQALTASQQLQPTGPQQQQSQQLPQQQQQLQQLQQQLQQLLMQQLQQQPQDGQTIDTTNPSTSALLTLALPLLVHQLSQSGQQASANSSGWTVQQIINFASGILSGQNQQGQTDYQGNNRSQGQQVAQGAGHAQREVHASTVPDGTPRSSNPSAFPLYMPRDKECLSSYQCFLRQQIELFEAGSEDVKSTMPGRNKAIVLGQVGIRCRHCAMLPARHRGTGATYYPAKLDRLYQAAQNMAQTHFNKHCRHIPQEIVSELTRLLQGSKSSAGAGKKYWSDGARLLGVYEKDEILRLERPTASS